MWWIYTGLFALLFAAQRGANSGWVVIVTAAYVIDSALNAILSIKYGFGSFHKRDAVSIAIAILGMSAWAVTSNPLLAILMIIVVDGAGFWLTLVKTWHAPHSETLITWQLALLGNVFGVLAVRNRSFVTLVYPVYAVAAVAILVGLMMARRREITEDPTDYPSTLLDAR